MYDAPVTSLVINICMYKATLGTEEQDAQSNTGNRGTLGTKGLRKARHWGTEKQSNGLRGTEEH